MLRTCLLLTSIVALTAPDALAEDWPRFMGADGSSTTKGSVIPTEWDATKNVKWKTPLPGPGASSPIVVGDRIFLTCYTGYGDGTKGTAADLMRHLICLDRKTGDIKWKNSVANPEGTDEDPYKGYLTQHGYATNTPISDGKAVYNFFGRPGLFAYDLDGNQLWHRKFDSRVTKTRWGSAASPIFFGDNLILNTVEEDAHIYSLSCKDGSINWKFDTGANLIYATPNILTTATGEKELIIPAPDKVYGVDPNTGKQKWFINTTMKNEMNGSVIVNDDVAIMYGGFRDVGSVAVRGGGSGDVTDSHVVWTSKIWSYIATPVLKNDHLYWIDHNGIAYSMNAKTGDVTQKRRTPGVRGGRGVKFFASVLLSGDHVYAVSRNSGTFVLEATPEFELVTQNKLDDDSEFNGSPAVSDNQLFLRSNKFLYCIGK